jgi:cytochrome c oxidase subunit 3
MSSVTAQNIKQNNNDPQYAVNPTRFVLWLLIVASIMLFAGFTSAYIVRRAEGNWMQFALPASLWISTFTILLSSVSMVWAYRAAKKDSINQVKYGLITTLVLGFIFLYSQYNAFFDLVEMGVYLFRIQRGRFFSDHYCRSTFRSHFGRVTLVNHCFIPKL